ncbi:unnamed protein product [Lymnaea stagnalis]|uniref:PARP12-like CCCH zinc finger tandem domain-containing protein n=1 Tax=Lymnaea stagnalis TaxID=6523 RepID=A0AAV2I308_LYMST
MTSNGRYGGASPSHRSQSKIPTPTLTPSVLVKIINDSSHGCLNIKEITDALCIHKPSDQEYLWKVLNNKKDNFIIEEQSKSKRASQLNGSELVYVFTKLTLCETHCRQAGNGHNRHCNGRCEDLHLCRTFLLCTQDACPFSKKRNCMFGHEFYSRHNAPLLEKHNLDRLDDDELRRLFRRPSSRSKTTMPQVCKYYNDVKGKRCANEKCKSLHLCSDFIEDQCFDNCPRNHNLADKRVTKILDLFGIDSSWREPLLLEHLQRYNHTRHQAGSSDDDISSCDGSEYYNSFPPSLQGATSVPNLTYVKCHCKSSTSEKEDNRLSHSTVCPGCNKLQQEVDQLKKDMFSLMTDVEELKKDIQKNQD